MSFHISSAFFMLQGVNTLKVLKTGDLLVGSGDGMLSLCSGGNFKTIKCVTTFVSSSFFCSLISSFVIYSFILPSSHSTTNYGLLIICNRSVQLEGGVTSVTLRGDGQQFYVGTEAAQIYSLGYIDFKQELIATNHNSAVKDVAFPLWVLYSLLPPEGAISFVLKS